MTTPIWMLLGFATWTVLLLCFTIGVYRWKLIFSGRAEVNAFRADQVEGAEWYKRAMRAHANCIENLPVFAAIVFALYVSGLGGAMVDTLCIAIMVARILQSLTHVCFQQTNVVATMRFAFFFAQVLSFIALIFILVRQ
ncbi:MAG: MAPEG family protein [Burkholderiales bacterium]|nr:MAPEG family protein [Burkholderiales bacterium]